MSTTYPTTKQTFINPSGSDTLTYPDHAGQHADVNDTLEAIQDVIGTTAGTSVLKDFTAGQFPVRVNIGGTIVQALTGGTVNNTVIGTSQITGGTVNNAVLGTPTITLGSDATGDIFFRSSGGTVTRLGIGSNGQVLTTNGTTPSWGTASSGGILTTSQYAPQGFLINGQISRSVSSNNITVALKGMDGNDPSVSNPVYVRIGNTVRTITSALSVTKNAGTNWMDLGSSKHAGQDVDLFVYLGYNATDGVVIGFARFPYATIYSDFSTTSTAEKYAAISTITNAASSDEYTVIGRVNASLSATASFNWSVPATSLVINYPTFQTRWMTYVPTLTWTAGAAPSGSPGINAHTYIINGRAITVSNFVDGYTAGTTVTRVQITPPIVSSGFYINTCQITNSDTPNASTGYVASAGVMNIFCTSVSATRFTNAAVYNY